MATLTIEEKAQKLLERQDDPIVIVPHDEVTAYRIKGNAGDYFVIVEGGKVEACTCPAGTFGKPCYHAEAVRYVIGERK